MATTNKAPSVSITNPTSNAVFTAPATISLSAATTDVDGISRVQFYNGGKLLSTDSTSAYTYTLNNVSAGSYSLTAKATDNRGLVTTSAIVKASVLPKQITIASNKTSSISTHDIVNCPVYLKLRPNPANNTINIVANELQKDKQLTILVVSASGALVKTFQSNTSNQFVQLDVSTLVSGVYTISVLSGNKVLSRQFIKL